MFQTVLKHIEYGSVMTKIGDRILVNAMCFNTKTDAWIVEGFVAGYNPMKVVVGRGKMLERVDTLSRSIVAYDENRMTLQIVLLAFATKEEERP